MSHFVLEIGTEEIPARFLSSIENELVERFTIALKEANLAHEDIYAYSTPRRSILHIQSLEKVQPLLEETALGPAIGVAYDAQGKLTKAGEGFARGHGVNVADLFKTTTEKGEYIAVKKQVGGKKAEDVLTRICPAIITALPFAKRMRWGVGNLAYARPMHWILALLDNTLISFTVGDVQSATKTYGHRVHGIGPFTIKHADDLEKVLMEQGSVLCDAKLRRQTIIEKGNQVALEFQNKASVLWKDSLLDEVQGLVEIPVPLVGHFDASFLELPKEVLLTTMEHHQKCFGLVDEKKKLLPAFLTVLNIEPENTELIRKGWERVLRARLEDARFYWNTDLKAGFDTWLPMLDNVIFLGPLGSMGDKSRRLEQLCGWLGEKLDLRGGDSLDNGVELAQRAGRWCKGDLVSQMVGEFDTLQGMMGSIYALKAGLEPPFAMALREQYLPTGPDSMLPMSDLGAVLSIADKADTLVGCFGIGNIPTGTADPYALRRAALGIVRILMEFGYPITLSELFEKTFSFYAHDIKWKFSKEDTLAKVQEFVFARFKNFFISEETLLVEAIMSAKDANGNYGADNVWATERRLIAMKKAMEQPEFTANAQTLKRVTNILSKQKATLTGVFNTSLFENDSEKALGIALDTFAIEFDALWDKDNYGQIFNVLNTIQPIVDAFFEGVMVMAEDQKIRENRLNMLFALMQRIGRLADFSALQL